MMSRSRVGLILLLFIFHLPVAGQFYEYGQDAGNLRWWQVHTPHYRVIYPGGVDSVARAFAGRLEKAYPLLGEALDHRHSPMPVVVHNESSFSNGVFVWAPKRLEIFSNPDPNAYNQDWLTQLAVHEGRHAVQIDKLNQGFTRGLYFLGGEQLVGAMAIFLPYWYLEGDAVDAETRLTLSGRGRQPSFEMAHKAQILEQDRVYSFSKASLGSYRHYIPDHYRLGYLMVRYGRRSFGDQFWIDFQQYAARKPYLLNPTWFSMRQYGLKSKSEFYRSALDMYGDHWKKRDSTRVLSPRTILSPEHRHYTAYRHPHQNDDGSVYALRSGMDRIPEIVRVDMEGNVKRIFRPGFMNSGRISFSGDLAVWDEFVPDTRWSNRNFAVIRLLDLKSGRVRSLGVRTRYFSPALSPDGKRIAVIEQSERQLFSLVILDLEGKVLKKLPSSGNAFLQQPAWSPDGSRILLLQSGGSEKSLVACTWEEGRWEILFRAGDSDISNPVAGKDHIYFGGTFSGIDNIYCLDEREGRVYQITSSRFGAFQPAPSPCSGDLLYSDYHAGGYRIARVDTDSIRRQPLEAVRCSLEQLDSEAGPPEKRIPGETDPLPDTAFPVSRYRNLPHLFTVHSWLHVYVDYLDPTLSLNPEQLPVSLGASLISQNHLSTAVSQLGYEYRDGYHMFHSGIKLKGRYPVFNMYFDYGGEPRVLLFREAADTAMVLPQDLRLTARCYVPLRLNTGKYLSLIQPSVDYSFRRDLQYVSLEESYRQGASYMYYSLYATSYLRMGVRDIWPRLGVSLSAGYYDALGLNRVYGSVSQWGLTAYFPGILKHQTLRLRIQDQRQFAGETTHHSYVNLISRPRGYRSVFARGLTMISADYATPLVYPDLELGGFLYLKRIRMALWTDFMRGSEVRTPGSDEILAREDYTSIGADLVTDMHLLRIPFPVSPGVRFIYLPGEQRMAIEALFSVDIR